jgi:DNA-binding transcriptional LysR family regulator
MDIKSFRYFISLARHRSFTKAAKECSVTQTAMSIHISKLEEKLNFKLFSRNSRNVVLTEAGAHFLVHAKRMLEEYEQAVAESYNISLGYDGRLLVGASNFPDAICIIDYIKAFHRKYPNILVETVTETEVNEPDGFRDLELDVAVCLPYELQADPDIDVIPLVRRPLRFVVSADHPLADKQKLNPKDLAGEKIFVLQLTRFRNTSDRVSQEWLMSVLSLWRLLDENNPQDHHHGVTRGDKSQSCLGGAEHWSQSESQRSAESGAGAINTDCRSHFACGEIGGKQLGSNDIDGQEEGTAEKSKEKQYGIVGGEDTRHSRDGRQGKQDDRNLTDTSLIDQIAQPDGEEKCGKIADAGNSGQLRLAHIEYLHYIEGPCCINNVSKSREAQTESHNKDQYILVGAFFHSLSHSLSKYFES